MDFQKIYLTSHQGVLYLEYKASPANLGVHPMLTVLITFVVGLPCLSVTIGFIQLVAYPALMEIIRKTA